MSEPDNMSKEEHAYWEGRAEEAGHIGSRRWTEEQIREAMAEVLCGNNTEDWSESRIIGTVLAALADGEGE